MYIGVKLVNYPNLYYFSHFTHFTLYLRKCEKYHILFNFVIISKFPIAIMETSALFPRHLEKHKFLLRSIEGVAFLTTDIGNYPCKLQNYMYFNIFNVFDIYTTNYNTNIPIIFDVFDMHMIYCITFHTLYL